MGTVDVMRQIFALNNLRWYVRVPVKWMVFGLTVLAVCFPYPGRLLAHVRHWRDPNALIEPDAPAIQPFVDELRPRLADSPPRVVLQQVERFVCEKIEYAWDWDTWGTADYLPTVTEVIEAGKEDCDGRAVVAASLLQRFGFNAQLVTDFAHMWVKTDFGETMGPGKKKAVIATERGLRFQLSALTELPRASAYGVAVFPLFRELIIVGVLWLLLLRRSGGTLASAIGLVCFVVGLALLRAGGRDYTDPTLWMQWLGLACIIGGFVALLLWAGRNARKTERGSTTDCSQAVPTGDGV